MHPHTPILPGRSVGQGVEQGPWNPHHQRAVQLAAASEIFSTGSFKALPYHVKSDSLSHQIFLSAFRHITKGDVETSAACRSAAELWRGTHVTVFPSWHIVRTRPHCSHWSPQLRLMSQSRDARPVLPVVLHTAVHRPTSCLLHLL